MRKSELTKCNHLLLAPESIRRGYCEACHLAMRPADMPSSQRWAGIKGDNA